jgi:8-oxo-dGTP pyrophosphatase MutT (NUDIX family)
MHPLSKFRFCPVCGSHHFAANSDKSKKCADCGFEYFLNASAANVAFILNARRELLVVTRKKEPARGTLDLPGGFADIGETAEEGVMREVMEETGLEVTALRYLFSLPTASPFALRSRRRQFLPLPSATCDSARHTTCRRPAWCLERPAARPLRLASSRRLLRFCTQACCDIQG